MIRWREAVSGGSLRNEILHLARRSCWRVGEHMGRNARSEGVMILAEFNGSGNLF